jgi:hypothetical protein
LTDLARSSVKISAFEKLAHASLAVAQTTIYTLDGACRRKRCKRLAQIDAAWFMALMLT